MVCSDAGPGLLKQLGDNANGDFGRGDEAGNSDESERCEDTSVYSRFYYGYVDCVLFLEPRRVFIRNTKRPVINCDACTYHVTTFIHFLLNWIRLPSWVCSDVPRGLLKA